MTDPSAGPEFIHVDLLPLVRRAEQLAAAAPPAARDALELQAIQIRLLAIFVSLAIPRAS